MIPAGLVKNCCKEEGGGAGGGAGGGWGVRPTIWWSNKGGSEQTQSVASKLSETARRPHLDETDRNLVLLQLSGLTVFPC